MNNEQFFALNLLENSLDSNNICSYCKVVYGVKHTDNCPVPMAKQTIESYLIAMQSEMKLIERCKRFVSLPKG